MYPPGAADSLGRVPNALDGPTGWQGPLRAGVAVLLAGLLVVWLVKPIGDACPDLGRLPLGTTASSSPSFSPPLTRTCTYTTSGGIQAHSRYVPWLDWLLLVLLATLVVGAVRLVSPVGGGSREPGRDRPPREPRAERAPPVSAERDDAERERARRKRAERSDRDR